MWRLWSGVHWGNWQKRITKHKYAVRRHDVKNGIAGPENTAWTGTQPGWWHCPHITGKACEWGIIHPPTSLTDELRLWPPHQPHMEPDPWSSLPTRDYLSPIVTRPSMTLACFILLILSLSIFWLYYYYYITVYVKRHTVLVIPLMKILRSKCLDLSTEVHSCAT